MMENRIVKIIFGSIGQPQLIGTWEKDSAVLIQNDSSYEITMVFSGIENRVETLQFSTSANLSHPNDFLC
jgi:hypothetical protein